MALNREDKQDVKRHYGKAIANKVEKATRDYGPKAKNVSLSSAFPGESRMDKLKSKVGSDNRKVNYKAGYKSMKRNEQKPRAYSWNGREVSKDKFDMLSHQKSVVERNRKNKLGNFKD